MAAFVAKRLLMFPLVLFAVYGGAVLLVMATPGDGLESRPAIRESGGRGGGPNSASRLTDATPNLLPRGC